jgi:hypothetical protein
MSAIVLTFPIDKSPLPKARKRDPQRSARRSYRHNLLHEATERAKASSDPIFGAIAAHLTAIVVYMDHGDSPEDSHEKDRRSEVLANACDEPLRKVLSTSPTTLEGLIALLEHVALQEFLDPADDTACRETFLSSCNEWSNETKRFGQDFPLRLAEAVRDLMHQ